MTQSSFNLGNDVPINYGSNSYIIGNEDQMIISYKDSKIVGSEQGFNLNNDVIINGNIFVNGNTTLNTKTNQVINSNLLMIGTETQSSNVINEVGILNQEQYSLSDLDILKFSSNLRPYPYLQEPVTNRIYLTNTSGISVGDMVNFKNLITTQRGFSNYISKVKSIGSGYIELQQTINYPLDLTSVVFTSTTIRPIPNSTDLRNSLITVNDGVENYTFSLGSSLGNGSYNNPGFFTDGLTLSVRSSFLNSPSVIVPSPPIADFYTSTYNAVYFDKEEDSFMFNNVTRNGNELTVNNRLNISAASAVFNKNTEDAVVNIVQDNTDGSFMNLVGSGVNPITGDSFTGTIVYNIPGTVNIPQPTGFLKIVVTDTNGTIHNKNYYVPIYDITPM